jgi:hypothetical protein
MEKLAIGRVKTEAEQSQFEFRANQNEVSGHPQSLATDEVSVAKSSLPRSTMLAYTCAGTCSMVSLSLVQRRQILRRRRRPRFQVSFPILPELVRMVVVDHRDGHARHPSFVCP